MSSPTTMVHAYEGTPVSARVRGVDVDIRIGDSDDVRIWMPRSVAEKLHTALSIALTTPAGQEGGGAVH
jgi:hypothetical protein